MNNFIISETLLFISVFILDFFIKKHSIILSLTNKDSLKDNNVFIRFCIVIWGIFFCLRKHQNKKIKEVCSLLSFSNLHFNKPFSKVTYIRKVEFKILYITTNLFFYF